MRKTPNSVLGDADHSTSINENTGIKSRDERETELIMQAIENRGREILTIAIPEDAARRTPHSVKIDTNQILTLSNGSHVVTMGSMEIWDGADLAMLREIFLHLFYKMESRHFGVDMSSVRYVPGGFFGVLCDWQELGVAIELYAPQPQIKGMLWFQKFFTPVGNDGFYRMHSGAPV